MPQDAAANPVLNPEGRPKLQAFVRLQHDDTRERWVLQAPERVMVLDETSRDIVELCDGTLSIGEIVDRFATSYDAPRDVIAHDIEAVIQLLQDKGLLIVED